MRRRLSAAVLVLVAVGCARKSADAGADADADAHAGADADADADAGRESGTGTGTFESESVGEVIRARGIGHTSVVFKVEMEGGGKAAFKPASRRGPLRYKGEIAARRLAVALGVSNVPKVVFRSFRAAAFGGAKDAEEMIVKDGAVKGALIPWIDGLEMIALESAPLSGQWKTWLRRGEVVPDDKKELAREVSTLVAFDFVTGNWDRWSGGNVGVDKTTRSLLYIDNDGAFFEVPPLDGLLRNKKLLMGIDKLSRSFVTRVRETDDAAIVKALGEETPGVPLLSEKALAGVFERRKQLLAIIDAKIGDAGADAVLVFP